MSAGTVESNNVYLNATTPISVIGSGGGPVSANLQVSTLSAFGLTNISSINGAAYTGAGSVPANLTVSSISTLALNSISSINGVAYTGAGSVPANLTVSSISTLALNSISSINGVAYTGVGAVPAALQVSSLKVNAGVVSVFGNENQPTQGRVVLSGAPGGYDIIGYDNSNVVTSYTHTELLAGGVAQLEIKAGTVAANSLLAINSANGVSISTITVSSFNGARATSFPAGSFNLIIPAFSTPQLGGAFPASGLLTQFSTTVGHTYSVSFGAFVTPVQPSVDPATVPTDNQFGFSVSSGADVPGNSLKTQDVYQLSRGLRSSFTISDTIEFIAGATGAGLFAGYLSNDSVNFNFTNSTLVSSSARVIVTDLGVI